MADSYSRDYTGISSSPPYLGGTVARFEASISRMITASLPPEPQTAAEDVVSITHIHFSISFHPEPFLLTTAFIAPINKQVYRSTVDPDLGRF